MGSKFLVVYPAYGRSYSSEHLIKLAWDKGMDFSPFVTGGSYVSIRDFQEARPAVDQYDGVVLAQTRNGPKLSVIVDREKMIIFEVIL